jgi:hypothetical protein
MSEECEIKPKNRFVKSPWVSTPADEEPCESDVEDWLPRQRPGGRINFFELRGQSPTPVAVLIDEVDLESIFGELVSQWKQETWPISSVRKRMSHPAYLKIIGMGPPALPFIFKSLREEPEHWFGALEAITRENLAPNAENMYQLRDAWLGWARSHGY